MLGCDEFDAVFVGLEGAVVPLLKIDRRVVMAILLVAEEEDVGVGVFWWEASGMDHLWGKVVRV